MVHGGYQTGLRPVNVPYTAVYTPSRTVKTFWELYTDTGMGIPVPV